MDTRETHVAGGESTLAVAGESIYFYYDKKRQRAILNGVNIAVNGGSIYSLLGPNGCGKTMLLKCIVGQHKPQAGSLKIYGRSPGSKGFFIPGRGVGYMPQGSALYMEMTTDEILTYFGSLYGLDRQSIRERITTLAELLDLPDKNKLIGHLSGGQQRRVSFAIALIHKPPLLILDEPTAGADPLLRKSIWNHLVSLAKNDHLTIIITTHYTEEARQAHTVGLMRRGQMLVERSPEDLIKQYEEVTFEEVFLKLCERNSNEDEDRETSFSGIITDGKLSSGHISNGNGNENGVLLNETNAMKYGNGYDCSLDEGKNLHENKTALLPLPSFPTECDYEDLNLTGCRWRLFYLTRKNFLRLKRNVFLTLFTMCISAVQIAIFFLCLSNDPFDLQVAVVNEDEGLNKYGEKFLRSVDDRTLYQKQFDNYASAYESLEKGESWAILHIDSDFSSCIVERVYEGMDVSNKTLQCSTINIVLDVSNYIISGKIRASLWASYEEFVSDFLKSLGLNPSVGEVPLQVQEYKQGYKPASLIEFGCPAIIITVGYVIQIGLTQMALIAERKLGLLDRALLAGATSTEVLMSFFFAQLMMLFLQMALVLAMTFFVFNAPCSGPVFGVILAVTVSGICGISFGFLISALTDDENVASLLGFGSIFPILILSGMFWPVEAMPCYMRYISYSLPLTRIIDSTRFIMTRGWGITHDLVWEGYLTCSAWVVVHITLSIILFKIRK